MNAHEHLMEELIRVRDGEWRLAEARSVVQRAGQLKDAAYAPVLKAIVARTAPTNGHLIAFDAMHALWLADEGPGYFLQLAQSHASQKMEAYYAILILARRPDPQIMALLQQIQESSEDNQVRGAVDLVKFVAHGEQQLRALPGPVEQADFLIEKLRTGWNPIHVEEHSPLGNLGPVAVWSQGKLRELSERYPGEVLLAISKIGPASAVGDEWPKFKAYVTRFTHQGNSGQPVVPR